MNQTKKDQFYSVPDSGKQYGASVSSQALQEIIKVISEPFQASCDTCNGLGFIKSGEDCPTCHGSGKVLDNLFSGPFD